MLNGEHHALLVVRGQGIDELRIPIGGPQFFFFSSQEWRHSFQGCIGKEGKFFLGVEARLTRICSAGSHRGVQVGGGFGQQGQSGTGDGANGKYPESLHEDFSFSLWLSVARSVMPKIFLSSSIRASDSLPNGALPSKACSTMPSRRSPRVMSRSSANAFSTLRMRFSMRTPVWTRSTSISSFRATMVHMYHGTKFKTRAN